MNLYDEDDTSTTLQYIEAMIRKDERKERELQTLRAKLANMEEAGQIVADENARLRKQLGDCADRLAAKHGSLELPGSVR